MVKTSKRLGFLFRFKKALRAEEAARVLKLSPTSKPFVHAIANFGFPIFVTETQTCESTDMVEGATELIFQATLRTVP